MLYFLHPSVSILVFLDDPLRERERAFEERWYGVFQSLFFWMTR